MGELHINVIGALVVIKDFTREFAEDVPHEFYFSKGSEEIIVAITRAISRICGPYILVNDLMHCALILSDMDAIEWISFCEF